MANYKAFDPIEVANNAMNYLTSMTDEEFDYLPYWLLLPHKKPAEAAHCKVDDAELVASWFEGLSCLREMTGREFGAEHQAAFRRHLMKAWGEHVFVTTQNIHGQIQCMLHSMKWDTFFQH